MIVANNGNNMYGRSFTKLFRIVKTTTFFSACDYSIFTSVKLTL